MTSLILSASLLIAVVAPPGDVVPVTQEVVVTEEVPVSGHIAAAGHKPTGFTLLGQTYKAETWRGVLLGVCAELAKLHGERFAPLATTVRGKTRQYIAPSPDGMISPAQIPGTNLWVETNQRAVSVMMVVSRPLQATGHDEKDFAVSYQ